MDLAGADALLPEPVDGLGDRLVFRQTVEPVAVDLGTVARVRLAVPPSGRLDGANDRQVVRLGKVPVALVLARHGHDRPGAVTHQDVVGEVDRHRVAVERVQRVAPGEDPPLVQRALGRLALDVALLADACRELFDLGAPVLGRDPGDHGVLRSENGIRHPERRVGAGGEHPQLQVADG